MMKKIGLKDLNKFVEEAGFKSLGVYTFEKEEKKKSKDKYKLIAMIVLSIVILYVSMAHMIGVPEISFIQKTNNSFNYAIPLLIFPFTQVFLLKTTPII